MVHIGSFFKKYIRKECIQKNILIGLLGLIHISTANAQHIQKQSYSKPDLSSMMLSTERSNAKNIQINLKEEKKLIRQPQKNAQDLRKILSPRLFVHEVKCQSKARAQYLLTTAPSFSIQKCISTTNLPTHNFWFSIQKKVVNSLTPNTMTTRINPIFSWQKTLQNCIQEREFQVQNCSILFSREPLQKKKKPLATHLFFLDVKCQNQHIENTLRAQFFSPISIKECSNLTLPSWKTTWLDLTCEPTTFTPWQRSLLLCLQKRNYNFSFCQVRLTKSPRTRALQVIPNSPFVSCEAPEHSTRAQCRLKASTAPKILQEEFLQEEFLQEELKQPNKNQHPDATSEKPTNTPAEN